MKVSFLTSTVLITLLCGCESGKTPEELSRVLKELVPGAEQSLDEFKKLRQIEYRIFSMPAETDSKKMAGTLNKLGKESWNCYHIEKRNINLQDVLTFFCKRGAQTPLQYIPKTIINR